MGFNSGFKGLISTERQFLPFYMYKKGKEIPLQAWTGPEGSRRFRLPNFKTTGT